MSDQTARRDDTHEQQDVPPMVPAVDVFEDPSGITLLADLPGVPKDRLKIDVEGDTLTIAGDLALPMPDKIDATHAEISVSSYRRAFTLSKELDSSQVKAEYQQGVLKLRIPKHEHMQPRKVVVEVA